MLETIIFEETQQNASPVSIFRDQTPPKRPQHTIMDLIKSEAKLPLPLRHLKANPPSETSFPVSPHTDPKHHPHQDDR
jgi:hypothetical protein